MTTSQKARTARMAHVLGLFMTAVLAACGVVRDANVDGWSWTACGFAVGAFVMAGVTVFARDLEIELRIVQACEEIEARQEAEV